MYADQAAQRMGEKESARESAASERRRENKCWCIATLIFNHQSTEDAKVPEKITTRTLEKNVVELLKIMNTV